MKNVLGILLVLIAAAVGFVASRPSQFHVARSISVAAPASSVFSKVDDFHEWAAWSPWQHLDPAMKTSFSGAESGAGAVYQWSGNDKVGEGRMTITSSQPDQEVAIKLEFIKPFQATNSCTFTLEPEGEATKVTWAMDGTNNFIAKAMCIFMSMDKMVGGDFERGLGSLKQLTESAVQTPAEGEARGAAGAADAGSKSPAAH